MIDGEASEYDLGLPAKAGTRTLLADLNRHLFSQHREAEHQTRSPMMQLYSGADRTMAGGCQLPSRTDGLGVFG